MSTLKGIIAAGITEAMKAKDTIRLATLRSVSAAIQTVEKTDATVELGEDDITAIIAKAASQRRESAKIYTEQNRPELATQELAELEVIESLLPKALTPEETAAAVAETIAAGGYNGMKDMKFAMADFNAKYLGRVDTKAVAPLIKAALTA